MVVAVVMLRYAGESGVLRKYRSMPSASCAVQMGAMVRRAAEVSRHERPAMLPESSMTKMVSKVERKAYGSSAVCVIGPGKRVVGAAGV